MVPDADTIARRRHLMRTIIRSAAVLLLVLYLLSTVTGGLAAANGVGGRITTFMPTTRSIFSQDTLGRLLHAALADAAYLVTAVGLLVFERRLVAWLVPLPRPRCPQCDYFLISLTEPRCPECGLPLTHEFLDTPPASPSPSLQHTPYPPRPRPAAAPPPPRPHP